MNRFPNLKQDAFISYKHDNNLDVDEKGDGWVDRFHQRLEIQLVQLIGRKAQIWRDPQLAKNIVLIDTLQGRIRETVALIAVLSPGYLTSEWCMAELREFRARAEEYGGIHLNGKSRIFAVVKLPPNGEYPKEIEGQLRYEFFKLNDDTKRPDEFGADLGVHKDQRYWTTLASLAWDLKELLQEMGLLPTPVEAGKNILATGPSQKTKKTIYLAETTDDLSDQRRQIKDELILHGYKVLPDRPLPYVLDQYSQEVSKNLSEADFSINLLGRSYGLIPEGAGDRSIVRLQLELATEHAATDRWFRRLIWSPEGWETSDVNLNEILRQLKLSADPHKGLEFWQTSLQEFKTLMHSRLKASTNGHVSKPAALHDLRKVYLICDRSDIPNAKPLMAYLHKRGFEVVLPAFDETGDGKQLTDLHQQNLLESDGVIVFYGHGSSAWAASKKSDIEKHAGLEKTVESARIRPLRAKLFYVAGPLTDLKDVFETHVAPVVRNFGPFDPEFLNDFISDLEKENDGNDGGNDNV